MDDREVAAAIAAGDPAGIAVAYDRYAAALYGYCQWILLQPSEAAAALRDTFVIATARLSGLPEAARLRARLYSIARKECERRLLIKPAADAGEADAAGQPPDATGESADAIITFRVGHPPGAIPESSDETADFYGVNPPADAAGGLTGAISDSRQAELQMLIHAILAGLKSRDREVIELNLRHDLHDGDLAVALGVSWRRADVLASRARSQLEKALGALLVARTGRTACPALDALLADWDGNLTEETRELVGGHIERCETCAGHHQGTLRPAALPDLLPLATPPFQLKEQVLQACAATTADAVAYRSRTVLRANPTWRTRLFHAVSR